MRVELYRMPVETDDYIKLLKQEADFQSSGHFSLEAKKALEKMQEFRLQDPSEYILQLVSCAVMRGASQLQIEINGRDVRVGFDGEAFSAHELEQIFDCASQHSQHPLTASGAHLAIALQAMHTYNPDVLIVESRDGAGRNVLQLYEEKVWIETLTGPVSNQKMTTYVGFERSLTLFNLCFPSLVGAYRAEHGLLRQWAFASPIPITVNGSQVPFFTGTDPILLEGPGRAPIWAKNRVFGRTIKNHSCWGLAERSSARQGELNLIQAGICFRQSDKNVRQGLALYLQEDSLRRDLSQRGLIKNEARNLLIEAAWAVLQ